MPQSLQESQGRACVGGGKGEWSKSEKIISSVASREESGGGWISGSRSKGG